MGLILKNLESWLRQGRSEEQEAKMNKKHKAWLVIGIFLLIFISVGLYVIFNYEYFEIQMNYFINKFGLIGILITSFLADLFEHPFGPEIPASVGVLLGLNFVLVIIFSVLGSYLGSLVNFYIGRKYLSKRVGEIDENKIQKKHYKFFNKYGKLALVLAAISPVPWVAFCWLAGIFKMSLKQFFIWGLIPRFLRILSIVLVVWYVGGLV